MKLNRVVFSYTIKITDEPFDFGNDRKCEQTARITFRDSNKNIIENDINNSGNMFIIVCI